MLYLLPLLFAVFPFFLASSKEKLNENPNIILIYMDDLGFGDLSCNGALGHKTPALDRLASNSLST